MKCVNQNVHKKDARALVTGQPVYTEDIAPKHCLVVKVLRSSHAYARIRKVHTDKALAMPKIACVLTHEDVPTDRFTMAGQSYPEPSPYDRRILDEYVRYVGDPVAIVAGEDEKCVNQALKLIKVDYDMLEPVLDMDEAMDHKTVIHPEEDYHVNFDIGNDVKRNICSSGGFEKGDVGKAFSECDAIVEETYHTKANNQAPMETFRTYSYLDYHKRLTVVSSTQVPFHVRRIVARALDMNPAEVRVLKPRIGGGFGAKQTLVSELFPSLVTLKTGKAAMMIFNRQESFCASTSRHEMKIRVKVGADREGHIKAIEIDTLSNTGAYGEHGPTTVGLSACKTMTLYNKADAFKFNYNVVYTNTMSAGAFRGYGATQGTFALESAVNQLAEKLQIDPVTIRLRNLLEVGEVLPTYEGETLGSCALVDCIKRGKELIGWDEKYPYQKVSENRVRGVGMAITMQGSSIANIDIAAVKIKFNDNGHYTLMVGATDMGTGCDTILAQMAAECLKCDIDRIVVVGVDTDQSPYDTGSYASSTTYLTGMAVIKTCEELINKFVNEAAKSLKVSSGELDFDGYQIGNGIVSITLDELAVQLSVGDGVCIEAGASHASPVSPPPFMAGFAEVEVDLETGQTDMIHYVGVVDCGTPINPNLARIQTEGGIVQGIGMALHEDIKYNTKGKMINDSFMQYRIPSRLDVGHVQVAFESSYEPTGPFGAKSIGEVVINTPPPAIAHAIYNATGVYVRELPITAEKVLIKRLDMM